ncbi:MAG: hypothetical protein NVS3B28_08650 [Candidatus Velthaea sp.]
MRFCRTGFRLVVLFVALIAAGCGGGSGQSATPPVPLQAQGAMRFVPLSAVRAVAGPAGFSATRASFVHSLLCDNGVLIAAYARQYGIQTIFVPVSGDDISSLLAGNPTTVKNLNAISAVAKVYMVSGDASWLAAPSSLPPDAASLAKIAAMYPQFAGILYAADPERSTAWNTTQRPTVIQQYFTLVQTLLSAPGASAFHETFFIAHPDFATLLSGTTGSPTMLRQLQSASGVTGLSMIAPGNSATAQLTNLKGSLSQLSKPFWIESSTSKYDPSSYNGVTPAYLQSNLSQLQQMVAAQNPALIGIEVSGWNDLYNSLQSVLPQPAVWNGTLATGPLVPPAGTTYAGAYVNPAGTGVSAAQTAQFESQIGRTLAYDMHFYSFKTAFPGALERDDIAHGRIPLIAWNCGDTNAAIASGKDDAIIIARAQAIKAFGSPIFLRWFWEMNLDDTNDAPRKQCYDPNTDLPNGYFSPQQYIAAWKHIHQIFAQQGVTNVVWLWCVANAHGGPSQYYPGDDQVDWVGMDDYDLTDVSFHDTFFIPSNELAQFQQKPFMITETGAHPNTQHSFLTGGAAVLQSQFPQVRAIGYLDGAGTYSSNWALTTTGIADFSAFANDPYLSAMSPTP